MLLINVEPLSDRGASVISRAGLLGFPSCRNWCSDRRWTDFRIRWYWSDIKKNKGIFRSSEDTFELRKRILILTYNRSLNWYLLRLDTRQLSPPVGDPGQLFIGSYPPKDIVVLSLRGTDAYVDYVPEPTANRYAACFLYSIQISKTFSKLNHNFSSKALHILYILKLPPLTHISQVLRSLWIQNPTSK